MKATEWTEAFASGKMDDKLSLLYGNAKATLEQQRQRYVDAIQAFTELYPEREDLYIYSAPGRTEVGGNHTDHQHGCVLAAAVNLDAIAIVSFHEDQVIRLKSANYPQDVVDLTSLYFTDPFQGTRNDRFWRLHQKYRHGMRFPRR